MNKTNDQLYEEALEVRKKENSKTEKILLLAELVNELANKVIEEKNLDVVSGINLSMSIINKKTADLIQNKNL